MYFTIIKNCNPVKRFVSFGRVDGRTVSGLADVCKTVNILIINTFLLPFNSKSKLIMQVYEGALVRWRPDFDIEYITYCQICTFLCSLDLFHDKSSNKIKPVKLTIVLLLPSINPVGLRALYVTNTHDFLSNNIEF